MEITIYIRNEISLADLSIIIFMNCGIKEEVVSTPAHSSCAAQHSCGSLEIRKKGTGILLYYGYTMVYGSTKVDSSLWTEILTSFITFYTS
ncbi:MAG: hypothetical protein QW388_04745 [Thermoplasmatales archaeon]